MSQIPKNIKSKYNNNKTFAWVDSQWEKFMTEQKEHKKEILELKIENSEMRDRLLELTMENAELKDQVLDLGGEYKEERTDDWKIEQFNRNRAVEDQVSTIKEMKQKIEEIFPTKYIYQSPDSGKTIYRRQLGDYNNREEVTGQLNLFDD